MWFTAHLVHVRILENEVKIIIFRKKREDRFWEKIGIISASCYILAGASIQNSNTKWRILFTYSLFTQKLETLKMHSFPDINELHFTKTIFMVLVI